MNTTKFTVPIQLINKDNRQVLYDALKAHDKTVLQQGLASFNLSLQYLTYVQLCAARGMKPLAQLQWLKGTMEGNLNEVQLSQADAFPTTDGRVVSVFFEDSQEPADLTWTQLFTIEDFRNTTEEAMEIWNVNNGITFRVYQNGEKVELYGISGNKQRFEFQLIGAGFQWLTTWLNDNKFWRLTDGLAEAATQYAKFQAESAYAVMAAGASSQTRATAGSTEVENDILTINAAKTQILANLRTNSGFIDPNPRFQLVYNTLTPSLADTRIARIANARYGSANSTLGVIQLDESISILGSPNAPTGTMQLVYPGRKMKTGLRQDLTAFDDFDPYSYSGARVFWGRWIHVKADGDQVRLIPLS